MTLTIRPALESDAMATTELMKQFIGCLRGLGDTADCQFSKHAYRRDGFSSKPAFFEFVAESGDKIVGYLLYHLGNDVDSAARKRCI